MLCFERLLSGLEVAHLESLLRENPSLWGEVTARQDAPGSPHRDTRCIVVLGPRVFDAASVFTDLDVVPYRDDDDLHSVVSNLLLPLLTVTDASRLGRVMLAELAPGGFILPHADAGSYAAHYSRFHIVVQSAPGNHFSCGGECVEMRTGEAWWFDHRRIHSVVNRSQAPRIHLIVDAVTPHRSVSATAEGEGYVTGYSA